MVAEKLEPPVWIRIGKVGRPHGVRGDLRVFSDSPDAESLRHCRGLCLELPDGTRSTRKILRARPSDRYWIVQLEGCTDRDQAAALTGAVCLVDRAELPPPEEGDYYVCDLIGLAVKSAAGEDLGVVVEVFDNGAHDVIVYRPARGGEVMLPFLDAFVPTVDLASGVLVVSPEAIAFVDEEVPP